ncbi:MAG: hypothetical protein BroJett038_27100 [Chloroflexota bacterium]|nr:MAG: hypothetical protein BroJett038_27100 [Chloroflexota bacterium]
MTDDFNQLRPPNDHDDSGDELDWLSDVPEQPGEKPDDRLGFTGELAWRQDVEAAFEEQQPGMSAEFDWQADEAPDEKPGADDDLPDWLTPFAQGTPAPDEPPSEDVPPWLAGFEEEAEEEEAAPVGDVPPWLREDAEETFGQSAAPEESQVSGGDVPPWLAGFEEETAAEAGEVPVVDWLMQPAEMPDLDGDDLFSGLDEALGIAPAAEPQPPAGLDAYLVEEVVEDDFFDQPAEEEPAIAQVAAAEPEAEEEDWLAGLDLTPEPAVETPDDWFTEAEFEQDVLADEPAEAGELPDWLVEAAPSAEAGAPKDIFGELGLPSPETGYEFLDQPEDEWFAEEPSPGASPGWLEELGEVDLTQLEPEAAEPEAEPADADFLAELQPAAPTFDTGASALDDLESLLASYEAPAADTGDRALLDTRVDIDRLLSDEDLEQIAARRSARQTPEISPDAPEWLSEMGLSVGAVSAAAILRKQSQDERPLDELDERLLALHESGLELTAAPEETPPADLKSLLPGVTQFIPPAPIKTGATGIAGELALTPEQAGKVRLLRSLAAVDEETAGARMPSAIDLTYETPSFADILAEESEEETPLLEEAEPAPAARPTRRRVKVGRLVMALLITAAVVLPFVFGPLRVGDLPPQQFAPGSRQQIAFDRVDALRPGDLALVAAEYGPTGAAELDGLTEVLLRHIQGRGARPVIVSTNALGLLHVQAIGQQLGGGPVLVRYLAGGVVGLRAFGGDAARFLATDINGRATNLDVDSLRDFALVVVIAERAEDLRAWAEQIAPLTGAPLVAASGFSAAPLVEPYTLSGSPGAVAGIRGLLVGYADAYTYHARLNALSPADMPPPAETAEPTQTPIPPAAEATAAPEAAESTPESAEETPEAAESTPESAEETPEAAESTPESAEETPEPPAAPELVIFGVVRADQAVNVREGPGRTFTPVASVRPRERVQIIGRSGDSLWLLIRLEDGREGWIASDLIEIAEPPTPTPNEPTPTPERLDDPNAIVALVSDSLRWSVPAAPVEQAASTPAPALRYGAERWYGMTLGLIVIIAVIALGTVGTIFGSLFRRRRR